ncbi:hypothetical protein KEM56_004074, partial [Ascosphaera pollenicola]
MQSLLQDTKSGDENAGGIKKTMLSDNLGIDYVLLFNYGKAEDKSQAVEQYRSMIRSLSAVGLETEVRAGEDNKLLIFVRAREEPLRKTVQRIRVRDWLHGVRQVQPPDDENAGVPERESERLQTVFNMIVFGADISSGSEEFPLLEHMQAPRAQGLNMSEAAKTTTAKRERH